MQETTLFFGDFKQLDKSRLEALVDKTVNQRVYIVQGVVKEISFNQMLTEGDEAIIRKHFDFEFIEYQEAKKRFMEFNNKYVIESNELLEKAIIDDLNLVGRSDVQFLKFEISEEAKLMDQLKQANVVLLNRVKGLSDQLSDVKILVSAVIASMPEEQRNKVNEIYQKSKQTVSETIKISQDFMTKTAQLQGKISILDAFASFEEQSKIEKISEAAMRNLEKLKNLPVDEFENYVSSKQTPSEILNDRDVINAIIIAVSDKKD